MNEPSPKPGNDRARTLILPIGDSVGPDVLEIIAANIQASLSIPAQVMLAVPLPPQVFDLKRNQINALTMLKDLRERSFPHGTRILAVTAVDLFIPIFTFVFGEAQLEEPFAVISLHRLRRHADGTPTPLSLFYERAAKIAVHEIAHTFNLGHCRETDCLMKFMPDLDAIDGQDLMFCPYCERDLRSKIVDGEL